MKKYLVSIKDGKTLTIEADRMNIEKGSKISYSDKGIHLGTFTWDAEKLAVTIQSAKDNVPNL